MSADNFILINTTDFKVYTGCASNDNIWLLGQGRNLKDAIRISEEHEKALLEEGSYVEYGHHFCNSLKGYNEIREKV